MYRACNEKKGQFIHNSQLSFVSIYPLFNQSVFYEKIALFPRL